MTGGMSGPGPHERMRPEGRRNSQGIRIDPEVEAEPPVREAVLSALVEHEPGVLAEIAGLFSRRQFNIESLTVGPTVDESIARMTIVVEESEPGVDQAKKQLEKLVPVISVRELADDAIERELAIVKINGDRPDEVHAITEMYGGETLDAGPRTITVELTGDEQRIDDALDAYKQFGIREIMRTGYAALARGEAPTAPEDDPTAADGGRPGFFGNARPADERRRDGRRDTQHGGADGSGPDENGREPRPDGGTLIGEGAESDRSDEQPTETRTGGARVDADEADGARWIDQFTTGARWRDGRHADGRWRAGDTTDPTGDGTDRWQSTDGEDGRWRSSDENADRWRAEDADETGGAKR